MCVKLQRMMVEQQSNTKKLHELPQFKVLHVYIMWAHACVRAHHLLSVFLLSCSVLVSGCFGLGKEIYRVIIKYKLVDIELETDCLLLSILYAMGNFQQISWLLLLYYIRIF